LGKGTLSLKPQRKVWEGEGIYKKTNILLESEKKRTQAADCLSETKTAREGKRPRLPGGTKIRERGSKN